ncbi:MAG: hypothetical protein SGI84_11105 [Gemmatimonadota bacterium]|nr:hypothetical protein [Gemmatimonadota bacterium]
MRGKVWLLVALIAACDTGSQSGAGNVLRDSAGIQIAENRTPLLPLEQMWRVDPTPTFRAGGAEAALDEQLYLVMGATQLSDGRIAIGDQGSSSIRFFGPGGQHLKDVGRRGEGPGEFRQILSLAALPADSIFIVDLRRFHLFTGEGELVSSYTPQEGSGPFIWPQTFLGDGSYIGYAWNGPVAQPAQDRWIDSVPLFRVIPQGQRDSIGMFPLGIYTPGSNPQYPSQLTYGPRLHLVAGQTEIVTGFSDRYEIRILSQAGELRRIVRLERALRPVSAGDVAEYRTRSANAPGEDGKPAPEGLRALRERMAAAQVFAEQFPAFSKMLLDRQGNLWVLEYEPWEDAPDRWGLVRIWTPSGDTRWDVFQPDGRWLGSVTMPPLFVPLEIGADYVLGLVRDQDDIEQVRKHPLLKP